MDLQAWIIAGLVVLFLAGVLLGVTGGGLIYGLLGLAILMLVVRYVQRRNVP
jgi:hypothetical protein